ncbi:MAG TPA: disulfide bond formation protein B [Allosphingosinicella sp.]|jgi:disulfide bond formation protein DsbB
MTGLDRARMLSVLVPAGLLAGAYGSQYLGGLHPCEMCYWQRWPHFAALGLGLAAFVLSGLPDRGRSLVWLAALAILVSGAIGAYHFGVELGYFEGLTRCAGGSGNLEDVFNAPLIRCDEVQYAFLGISIAGWNAILSLGFGALILWLSLRRSRIRT